MTTRNQTVRNKLLVEGDEDKRVIPYLIEANGIPWGENAGQWIVHIEPFGGVEKLLKPGVIEVELKASGIEALGIILDADEEGETRWQQIRARCAGAFQNLPLALPLTGLVAENAEHIRLGVWLMPDNRSHGMLETFLAYLLPPDGDELWEFTLETIATARTRGAKYRDAHADKARIHTWLAWADPPGRQLHNAVCERVLDPTSPGAATFVAWFRNLYGV